MLDIDGPGEVNRFATPTKDTFDFYIDGIDRPTLSITYLDFFSGMVYPFVAPLIGSGAGDYRFYLIDKLPFSREFLETIEHGGEGNHVPGVYRSVGYYYSDREQAEF